MCTLRIDEFSKSYNGEEILNIPNFCLERGIYYLRGRNGSGKTTLLKCISGLIPYTGRIELEGIINSRRSFARYRELVRYSYAEPLYPVFLKGIELIKLYQEVTQSDTKTTRVLIERLGIDKFQSKKIDHYSSGMIKKLSIALAFIGKSKLILLDEPYNALDIETTEILTDLIIEYTQTGTSIIFTSHQDFEPKLSTKTLEVEEKSLKRY